MCNFFYIFSVYIFNTASLLLQQMDIGFYDDELDNDMSNSNFLYRNGDGSYDQVRNHERNHDNIIIAFTKSV